MVESLEIDRNQLAGAECLPEPGTVSAQVEASVVVPCFNEGTTLPYLAASLLATQAALAEKCRFEFLFVDDGSTDDTWDGLQQHFGDWKNARLLRHERNQGVAAAIMTGIRQARTEIVCSMDSDCTYDPRELGNMIALLGPGVDMVTASPYHARGRVLNVPAWRLLLSKGSSFLYRRVVRQKLATYTSCFRVYRRNPVAGLKLSSGGFQGIPELLALLDFAGSRIVEYPATLDVRKFGQSKMRILRTIRGHLGLLGQLIRKRLKVNK
jgi:glycosyltransferase involved in cell wall biosynthesis